MIKSLRNSQFSKYTKCNPRQLIGGGGPPPPPPPPHRCSVHLVAELHLVIKNTGYGPAYHGNISSLPKTTAGLMKLWVRGIFKSHSLSP